MTEPRAAGAHGNADQIAYWNDRAAVTWTALQDRLDAMFAELTARAIAAAAPSVGERVIDVGCGCGATVLQLARAIGPAGRVIGVDVSEPMAARARERVAAAGMTQAEIVVADASAHVFQEPKADLLFSRFGVMFFDAPVAALAHLRTFMRPGGRLLFAVWQAPGRNPWMGLPLAAGAPFLPEEPPVDPHAPGPFAFADGARLGAILADAGWQDTVLTPLDVVLRLSGAGELDQAVSFAMRLGPLARRLAETDEATQAQVRAAVAEALRPLDGPDGIRLGGAIWRVAARAP